MMRQPLALGQWGESYHENKPSLGDEDIKAWEWQA